MSAREVSETTPNLSGPTPNQSQMIQESMDEISILNKDEKNEMSEMIANYRIDETMAVEFH